jgi:chorismate mutase/prephenate dehydratase
MSEPQTDALIRQLRGQISDNDRMIVSALNTRLELVAEMRRYKESQGIAFRDGSREERLLRELEEANPGPLSPEGLEDFVRALLELTRREIAPGGPV